MKTFALQTIAIALFFSLTNITAQTKKIDAKKSTISWVGKKLTGEHSGTISIKEGSLIMKAGKLTGGTFIVDMSKINVTDLKAGEGKEDLEKHLKADDFFGTTKFPTSKLIFKTIADKGNGVYSVTADMTIKTTTNPVTFDLTIAGKTASTTLTIDRTKYDIKYGSGTFFQNLGDKTISDNFDLAVKLNF